MSALGEARTRPPRTRRTFDDEVELPPFQPVEPVEPGQSDVAAPATEEKERPAEAEPATAPAAAVEAKPARPKRQPATASESTTKTSPRPVKEAAIKGVPVHLSEDLNERLMAFLERTGRSHQVVLLDAIESEYETLGERIKEKLGVEADKPSTPLFVRDTRPAPKTVTADTKHKHTVRMTETNRQILDQITEELGAPSRNFLITTAYEAYLPTIEKS